MFSLTQTLDLLTIVIDLNAFAEKEKSGELVLLSDYIKYSHPPVFFERALSQKINPAICTLREVDKEAHIILHKVNKTIWPEVFRTLTREQLTAKRLEAAEHIEKKKADLDRRMLVKMMPKYRKDLEIEHQSELNIRARLREYEEKMRGKPMLKSAQYGGGDMKEPEPIKQDSEQALVVYRPKGTKPNLSEGFNLLKKISDRVIVEYIDKEKFQAKIDANTESSPLRASSSHEIIAKNKNIFGPRPLSMNASRTYLTGSSSSTSTRRPLRPIISDGLLFAKFLNGGDGIMGINEYLTLDDLSDKMD